MSRAAPLPDAVARERIRSDLARNFLVEAGAGSGKTTGLVERMLALVQGGHAPVDGLAAITFTRKAAAELRERFQTGLEQAVRTAPAGLARQRLATALADLDRCFIGTIHAFCSRLLRERAIEAGIDPAFTEAEGDDATALEDEVWDEYLQSLRLQGDPWLTRLDQLDIRPADLKPLFRLVVASPDVTAFRQDRPDPDLAAVRPALDAFLQEARTRLPAAEPSAGWDTMQATLRRVLRLARLSDGSDDRALLRLLAILDRNARITQNRWSSRDAAKEALAWFEACQQEWVRPALQAWREHRHSQLVDFVAPVAAYCAERRRARALMNFQDLLMGAATLLREHPDVRRHFARRYTHLLVDEFQDTDPVQAEVILLLTGEPATEADWRRVQPRPGALFVVGDPKQSIYRFRRADVAVYDQFKEQLQQAGGEVLRLTANFRSVAAIGGWVNPVVQALLPPAATPYQAEYAPLHTVQPDPGPDRLAGVYRITVPAIPYHRAAAMAEHDAQRIAAWIAWACAGNVGLPRSAAETAAGIAAAARPADFLILTRNRARLTTYARALEQVGVPFTTSGGQGFAEAEEVGQFLLVLQAVADPDHPVLTTGVLRGLFFGVSDQALYRFRQAGGHLHMLRRQPEAVVQNPDCAPVLHVLERLRRLWQAARQLPPAAAVERMLADLGAVPYAAAGELGETRAGNLFKLLERVRGMEPLGFATMVERLAETLTGTDMEEGQLRFGAESAVRLMNLHKAKGLEAPVVFLADPAPLSQHEPEVHIRRVQGTATGYYLVLGGAGYARELLATPPGWEQWAAEEARYAAAEEQRLLYVAVTRARAALVVSRYPAKDGGPWSALSPALADVPELPAPTVAEPARPVLAGTVPDDMAQALAAVAAVREAGSHGTYTHATVTGLVEDAAEKPPWQETSDGRSWGTAVHRMLEAVGRGAGPAGAGAGGAAGTAEADLVAIAAAILTQSGRSPDEAERLVAVAQQWQGSDLWARAAAASERYFEVPLYGMEGSTLLSGTADLIFREPNGWVLVDYKSDKLRPEDVGEFVRFYGPQLQMYARIWAEATGEAVREMWIWFVELGVGVNAPSMEWNNPGGLSTE